ncbi:MAG: replicative DNA helicase, partial [Acidobacteria bacterium]|nr:replicative DNA helicase [Acidobacteriota bacterium]
VSNSILTRCLEGSEEAEEVLDAAESLVLSIGEQRVRSGFVDFRDIFQSSFQSIDALHDRGKRISGLETGFNRLDEMTRGLQPSELIIIAARPSMGKTSLALDIARRVATHEKKPVGIFSLEMSREALVLRLLCSQGDVDAHKLQAGFASREDWVKMAKALGELAVAPIFIDDTPIMAITEMRAKARRLQKEHGLGLLIVDYLQLMSGRGSALNVGVASIPSVSVKYENRTQEVSAISRGLKALAKELKIPILAVSQLNRAPEERGGEPRLFDLRESGQIEQDADVVGLLYREEQKRGQSYDGIMKLHIAKQRNGPTGKVTLVFVSKYASFRNPPRELEEDFESEEAE